MPTRPLRSARLDLAETRDSRGFKENQNRKNGPQPQSALVI
jgi:hypothetical protein